MLILLKKVFQTHGIYTRHDACTRDIQSFTRSNQLYTCTNWKVHGYKKLETIMPLSKKTHTHKFHVHGNKEIINDGDFKRFKLLHTNIERAIIWEYDTDNASRRANCSLSFCEQCVNDFYHT